MSKVLRIAAMAVFLILAWHATAPAQQAAPPEAVLRTWYRMVLELVRHTPTYSPPVASRSFAYLGVTAYEAVASGDEDLDSLAGQLSALEELPMRDTDAPYDEAVMLHAAMAHAVPSFFGNTGPTGQRAMAALEVQLRSMTERGLPEDVVARSRAYGEAVAVHIVAWAERDGGAVVENMGFPLEYTLRASPASWVPTSLIAQQQKPLLPAWGGNRTFAMPDGAACSLPPPPEYSEDPASDFYAEAREIYDTGNSLSDDQRAIARFWSDDPMLSPTPPGHWISIAQQILEKESAGIDRMADVLARLGVAMADAFIGCWHSKYEFDLLRPVTYIQRVIDPAWQPLLITPPFPEYPSGHSTQSAAAAMVLTQAFGEDFAFEDRTHEADGLPARTFPSFWVAAEEAAASRLYGGIHFRSAIERGLEQGRCVGAYATALRTRN
jgi:hypothetical protein